MSYTKERQARYYKENKEKIQAYHKQYREDLRQEALIRYGSTCYCCKESRYEFLSIDHINGNGNAHRKKIGGRLNFGGYPFLLWLKRNAWPDGFQVACNNCNMARAFHGACPHELEDIT